MSQQNKCGRLAVPSPTTSNATIARLAQEQLRERKFPGSKALAIADTIRLCPYDLQKTHEEGYDLTMTGLHPALALLCEQIAAARANANKSNIICGSHTFCGADDPDEPDLYDQLCFKADHAE